MDGINLTNSVDEPIILSTEQLENINAFKDTLLSKKVVCKSEVLSLESFLGVDIITKKVDSKKLTTVPSLTKYEEVLEVVNEYSNDYQPVTNLMVLEAAKKLEYKVNELLYTLKSIANPSNNDFLDMVVNDKYDYHMDEGNLTKLSERSIEDVITYNSNYLVALTDNDRVDYLRDIYFNNEDMMASMLQVLTSDSDLVSYYYSPHLDTVNVVTMSKIVKIVKNGSAVNDVTKLINILKSDIDELKDETSWDTFNGRDTAMVYKRYKSLTSLLDDIKSKSLLNFLKNDR